MRNSRVRLATLVSLSIALSSRGAGAQLDVPDILKGAVAVRPASAGTVAPVAAADAFVLPRIALPRDLPKPFAIWSASATAARDSLVSIARAQIGKRYRFGGVSPEHGFDCSGLVRYVMGALHISLPRTAREQARAGVTVPRDTKQLQPGDLVMFGSGRRISHVGIYVGDGHFVQASSAAGRVVETPLIRPMVTGVKPWRAVRRVMVAADSTEVVPELLPVIDPSPTDGD